MKRHMNYFSVRRIDRPIDGAWYPSLSWSAAMRALMMVRRLLTGSVVNHRQYGVFFDRAQKRMFHTCIGGGWRSYQIPKPARPSRRKTTRNFKLIQSRYAL